MGDRVAVMRDGRLEQVDAPAGALRPARQPVRGGLHRLAGDEPAARAARAVRGPACTPCSAASGSSLPDEVLAARPVLAGWVDEDVVIGIRPEAVT